MPDVADAEALIPDAKTQFKDKVDLSGSELKDVERGRLQKVAEADMLVGGKKDETLSRYKTLPRVFPSHRPEALISEQNTSTVTNNSPFHVRGKGCNTKLQTPCRDEVQIRVRRLPDLRVRFSHNGYLFGLRHPDPSQGGRITSFPSPLPSMDEQVDRGPRGFDPFARMYGFNSSPSRKTFARARRGKMVEKGLCKKLSNCLAIASLIFRGFARFDPNLNIFTPGQLHIAVSSFNFSNLKIGALTLALHRGRILHVNPPTFSLRVSSHESE
ncbi:hypothetical protein B0H13DRAFT_1903894 [Mycena leptocephala]|nr:hypothetical protein B0H13DRAFT_1903894 [Mycena leptocephala]